MHPRADLHLPEHKYLAKTKTPQITEHDPHINAKRAVASASVAAGTLGPRRVHDHLHESVIHIPLAFDERFDSPGKVG